MIIKPFFVNFLYFLVPEDKLNWYVVICQIMSVRIICFHGYGLPMIFSDNEND